MPPPSAPRLPPAPRWTWRPLAAGRRAEPDAREWLGAQLGTDPATLPIIRDARGRPRLQAPFAGADCNWSHSGDGLLVALGHGVRVGIDLERERPRPRAQALAERWFRPDEAAWLAAQPEAARTRAFLRLWCAKEAVLKAHGHGLAFGLHRLGFEARGDALHLAHCDPGLGAPGEWRLLELQPAPGYLGALAWQSEPHAR